MHWACFARPRSYHRFSLDFDFKIAHLKLTWPGERSLMISNYREDRFKMTPKNQTLKVKIVGHDR